MVSSLLYKAEAIILKRKNIGEGDRMVTMFTKEYGKLHAIAKGVRRITSRRAAHLEVFCRVSVLLHKGKSLDVISEVTTIEPYVLLRGSLARVSTGYYICELVDRLLPEKQEHRDVYSLLATTLMQISSSSEDLASVRNGFAQTLLEQLGYLARRQEGEYGNLTAFIERIIERRVGSSRFLTKVKG